MRLRSVEILRVAVMRSVEGLRCGYDEFNRWEFFFARMGFSVSSHGVNIFRLLSAYVFTKAVCTAYNH